jgi:hypothetical protein
VLLCPGQLTLWVMQDEARRSLPQRNGSEPPRTFVELDLTSSLSRPADQQ